MKIRIIGAGPAGLYFGLLMKKQDPAHDVVIVERDGPDDTYGWGIVFSAKTLSFLRDHDAESHEEITRSFETWDNVDVVHRGTKISIGGNRFAGIARVAMLNILQRRCEELKVEIRFHQNVEDLSELANADLLVGADGANSLVRRTYERHFQPQIDVRKNRYIWLGTPRRFDGLTLTFRETDAGLFVAHSYKFNRSTSTFIVECVDDTWQRAGFEGMPEREAISCLERVFAADLAGEPLLTNNFVRWLNFPIIKNQCWHHRNVVLLGDALHTAHFSIGSGTKLALEDAIALAGCIARHPDVAAALPEFQAVRKPEIDDMQEAAHSSLVWFENAAERMHLEPIPLAYELMTRSARIDYEKLRRRDPKFVRDYDRWRQSSGG